MRHIEPVQRRFTAWICNFEADYFTRLNALNLLPHTLFLDVSDLLTLSKIISENYDIPWTYHIILPADHQNKIRNSTKQKIVMERPKRLVCEQNFFFRTARLVNTLPNFIPFFDRQGLKNRLLAFYWSYFKNTRTCTWTISCECTIMNCRFCLPDFSNLNS